MAKVRKARNSQSELQRLRLRLAEAEETIAAIREGAVDAIAVEGPAGRQIFTLQSAEQPYRILAEQMNEGAASISADGTILFCNNRLAEMAGRPREKLVGSPAIELVTASDKERFRQLLQRGEKGETRAEVQFRSSNGNAVPVLASLKLIVTGQTRGLCLVATDLRELKRAEHDLQLAHQVANRLAAIVTYSNDAIIGKTLEGIVTSWNPGAEAIYGYSAQEMIGHSMMITILPDRIAEFQQIMRRVGRGENMRHFECQRLRKDGKIIDVSLSISPLKDEGGEIVGASTIARDISDRKRAEEDLRRASLYTRSLIEASLDPLVTISKDGKITDVNEATEKATGIARDHLIESDFSNYFTEPEKAREGYRRVFSEGYVRDYPLALRHTTGKVLEVLYNASTFKNAKGEVEGVFAAARDITERKRTEEQLRKASLYTRTLIEASLDPLVTIDKDGYITDVNQATEEATGVSRKRLIGSNFSNYFTVPEKADQGYRTAFAEGFVRDYPLAIRHTSGKVIDVLYNASLFKNEKGEIDGVFAAARDVTERKRAEERLRRASRYARSLIEASPDPLVTISKDGTITDVNEATEKATGIAREQLIGSDFSNYFTEPEKAREGYRQVFSQGYVRDYPLALRHTSGSVMHVLYNATLFRNEKGEVEGVFAAARDITRRKQAEEGLQTERQRFRDVLDKLPVYVVLLTPDYHVALDNSVFRERFGESHGQPCYEFLFHRDSPCEICETYNVLKTGQPHQWKWTGPDGRHYDIFDFPFSDTDGSPLILEMGMDVTEREQAEEEVRRLNQELESRVVQRTAQLETANKELEAFTYSVSHDLRAPLRHISGFSKILTEEFAPQLPADAQHHLQRISEGTRRMGLLVDDLLNLARVGRRDISLQVAGLKSIVEEVIAALAPEIGDRKVEWKIGDLPYVECDTALMKQVFQNLISNALKFTRPRPLATVEIGQAEKDGVKAIFVHDNGVGFSMKYADKLFGVFQRLHRAEDFEGTGVGLATVQRIIQKHGGRIWAEAELDKGATFYFTLGETENKALKATAVVAGVES